MADLFFCFTFVVVCFFLNTFNISPGIIVGIAGAVVGFLIVYVFPILLYFFDLRNKNEKKDSQI